MASASAAIEYEEFLKDGDPDFAWSHARRRMGRDLAQLHVRHHRQSQRRGLSPSRRAICSRWAMCSPATWAQHPVYLWTLPMFHCNGWCFPWTLSIVAGTHVCLRWVRAGAMYDAIAEHKVTHLCGAPIVMSTLLNAPENERKPLAACGQFIDRRRAAAGIRARRHEGRGLQRHACLRPDRSLWPGDRE